MQKVLRKRILRDFKENLFRYLALAVMIVLCMYIIISLIGTADTIILGSQRYGEDNCVEDGEFTVFLPLSETEMAELQALGVTLEEQFYLEFEMEDQSTLRVFQNRENINWLEVTEGVAAEHTGEVVLEHRYAAENDLHLGDEILIGERWFEIVGVGCSPDYDAPYKDLTDSSVNSLQFGTAFVSEEAYEELLKDGKSVKAQEYVYAFLLNDGISEEEWKERLQELTIEAEEIEDMYFREFWQEQTTERQELEDGLTELENGVEELVEGMEALTVYPTGMVSLDEGMLSALEGAEALSEGIGELSSETEAFLEAYLDTEISNLTQYLSAKDNPRIGAAAADQNINKYGGLIAGAIILVLFAYVISVFVVYGIEKENSTIGALYALGVKRQELILHYLFLPVVITGVAGLLGCIIGFASIGKSTIMGNCYVYFSIPHMETVYPGYLLLYGIVLPPVISAVVNWMVIRSKLNKTALSLLRNEQKAGKTSNIKLGNIGFVTMFQIRQMLRELRTSFTVIGGMFISLLILMLGLNCYVMSQHISMDNKADTKFEYLYTYKYPEETVPEGGYEAFAKGMKKDNLGFLLDVTLLGITPENPFFDVTLSDSKSEVVISSAMANKYGVKVGEILVLSDAEEEMYYAFTVAGITQYSTGFYAFMDIDAMRELFGESEDYYNQVFADHALNIDSGRLYGVTGKQDIEKASDVFINEMMPMITMMISVSSLIFAVVLFLMIKVMLDRSAFHISMAKVFGYRTKEIQKLYLNGNFYTVAIGAAVCIPLAKKCMDILYPFMVSNVGCDMNLKFPWQLYLLIYGAVLAVYGIIHWLLVGRLKKVNLAEVLKNRE